MTHPDLERELGELLPCVAIIDYGTGPLTCTQRTEQLNLDRLCWCLTCQSRPAILAWVQRKLVESPS